MDPIVTGALVGAGSSVISNLFGRKNASDANAAASAASAQQWQREYGAYKSRYQDTMADMKAAGLNPILAAGSGFNVGSGPSASTPQTFQAPAVNFDAASTALSLSQRKKTDAETDESMTRRTKIYQEGLHVIEQIAKTTGETGKIAKETALLMKQTQKMSHEIRDVKARADQQEVKAKAYKLLDTINDGYYEILKIAKDDNLISHVLNFEKKVSAAATSKINKTLQTINNYYKQIVIKGKQLIDDYNPKSPQLLKNWSND